MCATRPLGRRSRWERRHAVLDIVHNPRGKSLATVDVTLTRWTSRLGNTRDMLGIHFELFYNGERLSGPEPTFVSRQTRATCCTARVRSWHFSDLAGCPTLVRKVGKADI